MPLGLELLLVLGLLLAIVAATITGGLVGRLVRNRLDGRAGVREAPPPKRAAVAATTTMAASVPHTTSGPPGPSPASSPVPSVAPAPSSGAAPSPAAAASPVLKGEPARRLAGLPPPLTTRTPSPVSPALAARGGVPISAGPLGAAGEPAMGPGRPVDPRVAAAPFALASSAPRSTAPGSWSTTTPATTPQPRRRHRRAGVLLGAAAGLSVVAVLALTGSLRGEPTGDVLQAQGTPDGPVPDTTDGPLAGAAGVPGASPGSVVPGLLPGAEGPGIQPGGGTTPGDGSGTADPGRGGPDAGTRGIGPGPAATPTPAAVATATPGPTDRATPQPTTAPTDDPPPTPRPTPQPTPEPTQSPAPEPTPEPTPAPTATLKPPVAAFEVSVDGLEISVANRTKGATSWSWTFGDGASSTARNPSHGYAAADTYTVTLVATATNGATDRATRTVTVGG